MTHEPCNSYCEHGGICTLQRGHEGLHDSRYCQWDDAHALSEEEADAVLASKPQGQSFLSFKDSLAGVFPEDWKL